MFDFADTKIFMDIVHGYVQIPRCFIDRLIDTHYFQRLRNIDQTGMRILYPDAKHDRFGHSLGVYHLGSKAVNALLENFLHEKYWFIRSDHSRDNFWAKNKVLFLIACLLHDVGHAPFSHSLEREIHFNSGGDFSIKSALVEEINKRENRSDEHRIKITEVNASPHEITGAMLIFDKLSDNIKGVLDDLGMQNYPSHTEPSLYAEHYKPAPPIDSSEIDNDLCFIVRMILGLKYSDFEPELQIRNCFIELLNGGNFDVDKLDYVMRDTKMSGISNIGIDVERLISAASIITQTEYHGSSSGFENLKKYNTIFMQKLRSDDESTSKTVIKGNMNGTLTLQKNTTIKLNKGSKFVSLKAVNSVSQYLTGGLKLIHTTSFDCSTSVYRNGIFFRASDDTNDDIFISEDVNTVSMWSIYNATVTFDKGFEFKIPETSCPFNLEVNGFCDLEIIGSFINDTPIIFKDTSDFDILGEAVELTVLGDKIIYNMPSINAYNTFSVGFKKQAINIIANVLDARDYLYRWIYAHHKVMYYANFLIPVIANEVLSSELIKNSLSWRLDYSSIDFLDDGYIITAVKYYSQHSKNVKPRLKSLIDGLLNRKYKKSLFKSLAEYDLLFESFSIEKKRLIHSFFMKNIDEEYKVMSNESNASEAGFISEEILCEIKSLDEALSSLQDIVWINASYKKKKNDPKTTYLIFPSGPTTLGKIDLLNNPQDATSVNTAHYFYLYYTCDNNNLILNEKLKSAIVHYFDKKYT